MDIGNLPTSFTVVPAAKWWELGKSLADRAFDRPTVHAGIIPRVKTWFRHTPRAAAVALLLASAVAGPRPATAADEFSIPARRARTAARHRRATSPSANGRARRGPGTSCSSSRSAAPRQSCRRWSTSSTTTSSSTRDFRPGIPSPPLSQMIERDDPIWNDDSVQIFLDTFHDRRTGYYFMVNGLGTQSDGPHRRGRGQQRRGLGRAVAVAGAAHRLRLVGRDRDPPDLDSVPGRARRDLGHQLRPQPAPIPGAHPSGPGRSTTGRGCRWRAPWSDSTSRGSRAATR